MKENQHEINQWLATVRRWITHDWEAKLVALFLACLVWYMVRENVARERKIEIPKGWSPPMLPPVPRVDARGEVR